MSSLNPLPAALELEVPSEALLHPDKTSMVERMKKIDKKGNENAKNVRQIFVGMKKK